MNAAKFRSYKRTSVRLRTSLASLPVLSINGITSKMFARASSVGFNSSLFIEADFGFKLVQNICESSHGTRFYTLYDYLHTEVLYWCYSALFTIRNYKNTERQKRSVKYLPKSGNQFGHGTFV